MLGPVLVRQRVMSMGRWVISLGVVSIVACADGGPVDSPSSYESVCATGDEMPCTTNANGPRYVCVAGQWDDTMCNALPMGGTGG